MSDPRQIAKSETDADEESEQSSTAKRVGRLAYNVLLIGTYVAVGVLVMMHGGGWGFITSLYVITQITTTIGYGDITMQTDNMRLFMTFYVLLGIVFVSNVLNDVGNAALECESEAMRQKLVNRKDSKIAGQKHVPSKAEQYKLYRLGLAVAFFAFFVISWMIFFATYESCSCSYGVTGVEGCDASNCTTTDAQTKNWIQGFYMAVITMTTVGFGDFTPQSELGRVLGSWFMFFGVLSSANMVTAIGATIDAYKKKKDQLGGVKMTSAIFDQMDLNQDGLIGKGEFLQFVLLKEGVITQDTVDQVQELYEAMDKDDSGGITLEEMENEFDDDE